MRILTINAVVLVSNIYDHAKHNSGSLKSTVDKVETAVSTVVGPVYHIFEDVPSHLLVFLDNKVSFSSSFLLLHSIFIQYFDFLEYTDFKVSLLVTVSVIDCFWFIEICLFARLVANDPCSHMLFCFSVKKK